jgi:hypothetical protein
MLLLMRPFPSPLQVNALVLGVVLHVAAVAWATPQKLWALLISPGTAKYLSLNACTAV